MPQEEDKQGGTATLRDFVEEKKDDVVEKEDVVEEKASKNEPQVGSKRWNEVYYEAKESKRENDKLRKDLDELRRHNHEIMEVFKSNSPDSPQNTKKELQELKAQKKELIKSGEYEKAADLEDKIDELREKIYTTKGTPAKDEDIDKIIEEKVSVATERKVLEDFTTTTEWFNPDSPDYDEFMAATAIGLDRTMQDNYKGTLRDRLQEVRKKVEERYGYKRKARTSPAVERVGVQEKPTSGNGVELTNEEMHIAQNLFPGDKEAAKKYYEQKQLISKLRRK